MTVGLSDAAATAAVLCTGDSGSDESEPAAAGGAPDIADADDGADSSAASSRQSGPRVAEPGTVFALPEQLGGAGGD